MVRRCESSCATNLKPYIEVIVSEPGAQERLVIRMFSWGQSHFSIPTVCWYLEKLNPGTHYKKKNRETKEKKKTNTIFFFAFFSRIHLF